MNQRLKHLQGQLFAPVDVASLVLMRIGFGLLMMFEVWRFFANGWIHHDYINPRFHFTYFGFEWVHPWPGDWMYWHFVMLAVAALGIALGCCYRLCTIVFFFGFTYVFLLEESLYLNHFYLICLISLQLIFVPAHSAYSIDAWLRPSLASQTMPAWCLWLTRFHIGLPYFFGGIAKLEWDWLLGIPMMHMMIPNVGLPVIGRFMAEWWVADIFAFGGMLFDLSIVPLLLWPKTRKMAYCMCLAFHLTNKLMLDIGIFPWFMIVATTIFFQPRWPRRFVRRLRRSPAADVPVAPLATPATHSPLTRMQRLTFQILIAWGLFQVLMPLRHLLYPGNCNWTEEGQRFAWRMKLRGKEGQALFYIYDPRTASLSEPIDPMPYLTMRQYSRLGGYPDKVLQFAHFLDYHLRGQGFEGFEIRAHVWTSLNNRKPQLLVDPTTNLAAVEPSLWPARWILPLDPPVYKIE